jgi:competence protein ComEC
MSYGAIVALVVLYERWRFHGGGGHAGALRRMLTYLGGIAVMSIVASAASAVFAIYHFQQSAFYGMGANLIAVPIHDLWIMPWGIASYVLMPIHLEFLALKPMGWGISGMLATARLFSSFPGASGHFEAMPATALGLVVTGGLWFLLWTRRWRWIGLAPVAAGIVVTLTAHQPDLLIADDGRLVATRTASGEIALSNRAHDRFTQSVWVRRSGQGDIDDHPPASLADSAGSTGPGQCSAGACRFTVAGRTASIVSDPHQMAAICATATDLLITPLAVGPDCRATLVFDKTVLAREGAISLTFADGGQRIDTVRADSGERPWSSGRGVSYQPGQ